ncbi:MAG TPA: hypothetical protein VF432_21055 [Thermoanaerobaculia bacterium]
MVMAGQPQFERSGSPVRFGRIVPETGDTTTNFEFVAIPPDTGVATTGEYRWAFRHQTRHFLIQTPWQRSPRSTQRFDHAGLYEATYEYRRDDGTGTSVYTAGDVVVKP